ncbi:MAG: hypothetical protein IPJ06_01705 [Saprospiraceae bacterium]|nr:hypothetical protein [Saprospiraceae bacterium]
MKIFNPRLGHLGHCFIYLPLCSSCHALSRGIRWSDPTGGFAIRDSYWCDLLAPLSRNQEVNPARPVALAAMMILCVAMAWMWWHLPRQLQRDGRVKQILHWGGIGSMVITTGLITPYHDLVIYLAGFLGLNALFTTLYALQAAGSKGLFVFGLFGAGLCLINFAIYSTEIGLIGLPILQKVTFATMLIWFAAISSGRYIHPSGSI